MQWPLVRATVLAEENRVAGFATTGEITSKSATMQVIINNLEGILTFSVASATEPVRAVSASVTASVCGRGTDEGRQGLMRVLVMEGKVSAAAATIDCSSFHQHMASVFGIYELKGPG